MKLEGFSAARQVLSGSLGPEAADHMEDILESPFHRLLGFELVRSEGGSAEIRLRAKGDFARLDGSDWVHGGVLSALVDVAGYYAVRSSTAATPPTIDMRIDFLRPARGNLRAIAKVLRIGARFAVADVEVIDTDQIVAAAGRSVYAIQSGRS